MSAEHRHLRGDTKEIELPIHGNVVVDKGDFMVCYMSSSCSLVSASVGSGQYTSADYYGYPIDQTKGTTYAYGFEQFAGVAMKGSAAGVTETIPVATAGIWRYPMKAARAVYPTYEIFVATSAANIFYPQTVDERQAGLSETGCTIGKCVKYDSTGTNCDFMLMTRFGGGTSADFTGP